jgi:hypothetical protein
MADFATHWDFWNAGLIDGPEPSGRRSAAEVAALAAEAHRNFVLACVGARRHFTAMYGRDEPQPEPPSMRAYRRLQILDQLDGA